MIRARGRYRESRIELDAPVDLPDGAPVEVVIQPAPAAAEDEWRELGMERLEQEWDNDRDAIYDDWRRLYGVPKP